MRVSNILLFGGLMTVSVGGEPVPIPLPDLIKPGCDNHTEPPYPYDLATSAGGPTGVSSGLLGSVTIPSGTGSPTSSSNFTGVSTGAAGSSRSNSSSEFPLANSTTVYTPTTGSSPSATTSVSAQFPSFTSNSTVSGTVVLSATAGSSIKYYYDPYKPLASGFTGTGVNPTTISGGVFPSASTSSGTSDGPPGTGASSVAGTGPFVNTTLTGTSGAGTLIGSTFPPFDSLTSFGGPGSGTGASGTTSTPTTATTNGSSITSSTSLDTIILTITVDSSTPAGTGSVIVSTLSGVVSSPNQSYSTSTEANTSKPPYPYAVFTPLAVTSAVGTGLSGTGLSPTTSLAGTGGLPSTKSASFSTVTVPSSTYVSTNPSQSTSATGSSGPSQETKDSTLGGPFEKATTTSVQVSPTGQSSGSVYVSSVLTSAGTGSLEASSVSIPVPTLVGTGSLGASSASIPVITKGGGSSDPVGTSSSLLVASKTFDTSVKPSGSSTPKAVSTEYYYHHGRPHRGNRQPSSPNSDSYPRYGYDFGDGYGFH